VFASVTDGPIRVARPNDLVPTASRATATINVSGAEPVVATASTPDGLGQWLVAADGTVRAVGTARFYGSLRDHRSPPIVAIAAHPSGRGYWLAAADGGVFAFGDARYAGSLARDHRSPPIVAIATIGGDR